jgi:hypothetical protein
MVNRLKGANLQRTVESILIEMPLGEYYRFMDGCESLSHEYALLKNGVIIRGDHFERILQIRCSLEDAMFLRDSAKQIYPDIVPAIERAIAAPRFKK